MHRQYSSKIKFAMQCKINHCSQLTLTKSACRSRDAERLVDWLGQIRLCGTLDESRVADDLADFDGSLLKSPETSIAVGEGDVAVGTPQNNKRDAGLVEGLASVVLLLDERADTELDGLEWARGRDGRLLHALTCGEDGLGAEFDPLVLEDDGQLKGIGADLLEGRVADHFLDVGGLATEGPGPISAVGEGDVGVAAAERDNGLAGLVEELAAEVLLLNILAESDFDRVEGPAGSGDFSVAFALLKSYLGAEFGWAAEGDGDLIVNIAAAAVGSGDGARGS